MIVVIVIVGILAGVAAPRFLDMNDFQGDHAHRQALADLRFAQRRAMNSGCPVQVDFTATRYTLNQRAACRTGTFTLDLVDPVTNLTPYAVDLPEGVTASSSVDPIVFDAMGRLTTTAGVPTDATITIGGLALQGVGETGLIRVP